jgi:hypothetical protein
MAASDWGVQISDGIDGYGERLGFISFSPTYRAAMLKNT